MKPLIAIVAPAAAGVILLAGCSGSSTPTTTPGATFTGANAAFCDGVAQLYDGMQASDAVKASPNPQAAAQAAQQLIAGARAMAANVPADAPASMQADLKQYASDLVQAVANPSQGAQIQEKVQDTFGPEVTQYWSQKCPSAVAP